MEGPRFTLHKNGSLEVDSVAKADMGQYTCYAENTEGKSTINAMLFVKG